MFWGVRAGQGLDTEASAGVVLIFVGKVATRVTDV